MLSERVIIPTFFLIIIISLLAKHSNLQTYLIP
jgi:hypothetical protein